MPLTDTKLRSLRPRATLYRVADADGLCVEVTPNGSRLWRYRYRHAGKAKMVSLGAYPEIGLAQARERRDAARRKLREGVDPSTARRAERKAAAVAAATTFRAVADEWLRRQRARMAPATAEKAEWLLGLIYSHLAEVPVNLLTPAKVLAALRAVEADGRHETAHRVKQRIGAVMRFAIAAGLAESDPTAPLRGALTPVVPRKRAAITDPARVGDLLRAIDGYAGLLPTRCAMQLAALTFVRPGELRQAEWTEFDIDGHEPTWRIPAAKTKVREEHLVPLAPQAVAILRELHPLTGSGRYLFPSAWGRGKPMSENTLNSALRRLGFDSAEHCAHGFRALASTRLNEMGWPPDVIERQLAHAERNKVRAAYNRAQYMAERRKMMQAWADYLDALRETPAKVTPIKRKAG